MCTTQYYYNDAWSGKCAIVRLHSTVTRRCLCVVPTRTIKTSSTARHDALKICSITVHHTVWFREKKCHFYFLQLFWQICINSNISSAAEFRNELCRKLQLNQSLPVSICTTYLLNGRLLLFDDTVFAQHLTHYQCIHSFHWPEACTTQRMNTYPVGDILNTSEKLVSILKKISPVGDWRSTSLDWRFSILDPWIGSWPWPWIRPYSIPSCITHRPLPIYQISFKSKKNFLWTDGRTDIFPPILLGRLLEVDLTRSSHPRILWWTYTVATWLFTTLTNFAVSEHSIFARQRGNSFH